MRSDPPGLRSVFVDSPELPADDTLSAAPGRTASALDRVLRSCADQPGCRSLPHSSEDVDRIAAALDAQPVEVTVEADGGPVTVPVDGALLVRLLRHMLSNNGVASQFYAANAIPAALAAADDRDPAALAILVEPMLTSAAYCEGFVPTCPPYHRITLGAYLETVCSHAGPPTAQPGVPASIRSTFDADPYRLACDRWPFQSAADDKPLVSDVPVLLMAGAWDPYVDPAPRSRWKDELAGLSRLTVVEVPGWGHNVLSSGACAQAMRNGFVAAPERSVDQSCLASLPTTPDFLPHL
jgi:hypothetical protein